MCIYVYIIVANTRCLPLVAALGCRHWSVPGRRRDRFCRTAKRHDVMIRCALGTETCIWTCFFLSFWRQSQSISFCYVFPASPLLTAFCLLAAAAVPHETDLRACGYRISKVWHRCCAVVALRHRPDHVWLVQSVKCFGHAAS